MKQIWHDLLFMHWPVAVDAIRSLVPAALKIETYDGTAWIGVVPFHMSGIRGRGLPPIPGTSAFPELNVRTYVRCQGKPGVWFFSLDAANLLAVAAARRFFHLPYFRAEMSAKRRPNGEIAYVSHRKHRNAPDADFRGSYHPIGDVFEARRGTIEHFLAERYCLYAAASGSIYRGEIDHRPWPLQLAKAQTEVNTMAEASGIVLPKVKPLLHFALLQDVKIWGLEKLSGADD
jgi:uncharacterized protein